MGKSEYCSVKGCLNKRASDCEICMCSRCEEHMTERGCVICIKENKGKKGN
jgi:hypothetical protein